MSQQHISPRLVATLENGRSFLTYSLAMTMLGKSVQIIAERGGSSAALDKIAGGIEELAAELRRYADAADEQDRFNQEIEAMLGPRPRVDPGRGQ